MHSREALKGEHNEKVEGKERGSFAAVDVAAVYDAGAVGEQRPQAPR